MFFLLSSFLLKTLFSTFHNSFPNLLISLPLISVLITLIPLHGIPFNWSSPLLMDDISGLIITMTIVLMVAIEMGALTSFYSNLLFLFSFLTFSVSNILSFYIALELNLVPIFLIILGWGYQPERIFANKMMMMYTLMGSLPLLLVIIGSPHLSYLANAFITPSASPLL